MAWWSWQSAMLSYFSSRLSLSGVSVGTGRWCHDMATDTPYVWMDFDVSYFVSFLLLTECVIMWFN